MERCFFWSYVRIGERSNDELDMLDTESKLRLCSLKERPRFIVSNCSGDTLRRDDGTLSLPNIDDNAFIS